MLGTRLRKLKSANTKTVLSDGKKLSDQGRLTEKHCVKSVRIQSYSGPHFPAFGLNTERYRVSFRIQSECGKMRIRITPNTDTFHAVKFINKLQNYYGIAIRSSCHGNVYSLKKAIAAVLYHCSEASSLEAQHQFCPTGVDSWCKYHADKETYKPKPGLPAAIREFIRPLFLELSEESLLSK